MAILTVTIDYGEVFQVFYLNLYNIYIPKVLFLFHENKFNGVKLHFSKITLFLTLALRIKNP